MKKILSFLLIVTLLAGCFAFAGAELLPEKDLIILYTGDVHCAIDKGWGYAGLYAMKESLAKDHDVLLVDNEALINYLKSLPDGALQERYGDPYGDGRIVAVGGNT